MLDQKKTVNTSEFHSNCERCGTDFIVPSNVIGSLITAATHCTNCVSALSSAFSATLNRKSWSNDAFAAFCEMYQTGKITLDQFCALIEGGAR